GRSAGNAKSMRRTGMDVPFALLMGCLRDARDPAPPDGRTFACWAGGRKVIFSGPVVICGHPMSSRRSTHDVWIVAEYGDLLCRLLEQRGLPRARVLEGTGITPAMLADPRARLP